MSTARRTPGGFSPRAESALPVIALGLLALVHHWLAPRRPAPVGLRAPREIVVTSSADRGPGSLREALVAAGSAPERTRVVVEAPRIVLDDPLPPLVNPRGIVVVGGREGCEIDAGRLAAGSAFDVAAPDSAIAGMAIRGAPSWAVLVRADRVRLAGLEVTESGEGVRVAEDVSGLVVEDSRFRSNGVGVRLATAEGGNVLARNRFSRHDDAAIWAVRSEAGAGLAAGGLVVAGNRFEEDRISVVVGNVPVTVEDNEIVSAFEAAVYLTGRGAVVRRNRIRGGARFGVLGEAARGSLVAGNEIDHNQVAVLLSTPRGTTVEGNRLYDNVYGIAAVLGDPASPGAVSENLLLSHRGDGVVLYGSSPLVRANRVLGSGKAGLRLTDFLPGDGRRIPSEPRLEANLLAGNGADRVRDAYPPAGDPGDELPEEER